MVVKKQLKELGESLNIIQTTMNYDSKGEPLWSKRKSRLWKINNRVWCKKDIEFLGEFEGNDWAIVLSGDTKNISDQIAKNVLFKDGKDCDSIKGILVKKELYSKIKSNLKEKLGDILNENPSKEDILNPDFCSSLWIKEISTLNEALELTKLNEHGLSIAIFDKDSKRALDIARRLNFARIIINSDTLDINPLIPWGGIKKTSSGGVEYWIKKFLNKKLIEIKK